MLKIISDNFFNPSTPVEIVFIILGGLGLFLYGITLMSDSLKSLAGPKLKSLIEKATNTPLKAILAGIIFTGAIQSSSGTTIIVIGLVSAGLMKMPQAIGVIMGSNIGTTVTAFLVGLSINQIALPIIALSALLAIFIANRRLQLGGLALLGFGILFFSLSLMAAGFTRVSEADWFTSLMGQLQKTPFLGFLFGVALTALIQSSSAFIGIVQQIYGTGSLPLAAAIMAILGSNIGTTITAGIASLSGNREAKQVALAHTIFNVIGVVIFGAALYPFTKLIGLIETRLLWPNAEMTLAIAHILFNVSTTLILMFFINQLVKLVVLILPSRKPQTSLDTLNKRLLATPEIALDAVKHCILEMGAVVREMFALSFYIEKKGSGVKHKQIMEMEELIDTYDHAIHDYLLQIEVTKTQQMTLTRHAVYLDTIRDLERIADHCVNLSEFYEDRHRNGCADNLVLMNNINHFAELVATQIASAIDAFERSDKPLAKKVMTLEEHIDTLEKKYRNAQIVMINDHKLTNEDLHYVDILSNFERISDHCNNIAENVINPTYLWRTS